MEQVEVSAKRDEHALDVERVGDARGVVEIGRVVLVEIDAAQGCKRIVGLRQDFRRGLLLGRQAERQQHQEGQDQPRAHVHETVKVRTIPFIMCGLPSVASGTKQINT